MSDKKAKAARKSKRARSLSSDPSPLQSTGTGRMKAIVLRALSFGVFLAIFGFGLTVYRSYTNSRKPLHEFNAMERRAFIDALKTYGVPTQSVWLACPEAKDETCRLMRQFISMFQESGWRVEGDRVITWAPAHPLGGVHLIMRVTGGPDDLTPVDSKGIKSSLAALGIPAQTAAAPDVPKNSIGVYFGPDL